MPRRGFLIGWPVVIVAAVLSLVACGGESVDVELTGADSGRSVVVEPGQSLVVTLESNPTTGFQWNMQGAPDAAVLELVSSTFIPPDTELVGAGGFETWTFRAVGVGETRLALAYFRPFDPEAVEGSFELDVAVQE